MRPFQIILVGIFVVLATAGLIFIAFYNSDSIARNTYGGSVTVWGTFDNNVFNTVFGEIRATDDDFYVVQYVQKDPRTFDDDLTTTIAEGNAPDLVVLSHESLVKHRGKLLPLSFETIPQRTFRDTYVDGAEIFMMRDAVYGLPFAVDPMVMYWNRDIFSSSGVAAPPKTWEELVSATAPRITRTNTSLNILQSTVAFGEYRNVRHAKDILAMLLLQAGGTLVEETSVGYSVRLNRLSGDGLPPGEATLSFYTQFALPSHENYSWNRSFEEDYLQFLGEELALYFGPGSEYKSIIRANPNLNFDITRVPQGAGATNLRNYGTFYAFAIPKSSDNQQGAFLVARLLGNEANSAQLAELSNVAPVHRAEIAKGAGDPYRSILYDAALVARGWLDPDPEASDTIFRQMVEDVTSGRERILAAINDAAGRLELLF